jgi:taurine-pyruvate aminotransferase
MFKNNPDDRLSYFRDVSTFGGCAAGPAAALENMRIIESEHVLENVTTIGNYFKQQLSELSNKHDIIGDVRGKGLFLGVELVSDRKSKTPVPESVAISIAAECMKQGVIIGRTNRSFRDFNNTLAFSPALIATKDDIDEIVVALDHALRLY